MHPKIDTIKPTAWFHAAVLQTKSGVRSGGYRDVGYHLGLHLQGLLQDSLEDVEIDQVYECLDSYDTENVITVIEGFLPLWTKLVPKGRMVTFALGILDCHEAGKVG